MLKINGIGNLKGTMCYGRVIADITLEENSLGEPFYVFHFNFIGNGEKWNKSMEVRLCREANPKFSYEDSKYELFVMGLAMVTGRQVTKEQLSTKEGLVKGIEDVLSIAKHWWETETK